MPSISGKKGNVLSLPRNEEKQHFLIKKSDGGGSPELEKGSVTRRKEGNHRENKKGRKKSHLRAFEKREGGLSQNKDERKGKKWEPARKALSPKGGNVEKKEKNRNLVRGKDIPDVFRAPSEPKTGGKRMKTFWQRKERS